MDCLDDIQVASPCRVPWNDMKGDRRVRSCAECKLKVYDLSAMSRKDAIELVQRTEGRLCVRFYRRADGTVMTEDCPWPVRAAKRTYALASRVLFSLLSFVTAGLVGCADPAPALRPATNEVSTREPPSKDPSPKDEDDNPPLELPKPDREVPVMGIMMPRQDPRPEGPIGSPPSRG
jgi:hypothetical protein